MYSILYSVSHLVLRVLNDKTCQTNWESTWFSWCCGWWPQCTPASPTPGEFSTALDPLVQPWLPPKEEPTFPTFKNAFPLLRMPFIFPILMNFPIHYLASTLPLSQMLLVWVRSSFSICEFGYSGTHHVVWVLSISEPPSQSLPKYCNTVVTSKTGTPPNTMGEEVILKNCRFVQLCHVIVVTHFICWYHPPVQKG